MTIPAAVWGRLDDALNPVLLKELRQAVRGRFVISALVLSLLAESITAVTMYFAAELNNFRLDSNPVGPRMFATLFGVIFFTCMLLVPIYCGMRMAAERADANTDLMYITTIAPRTIVVGKVLSVGAFVGLLFGGAAPFLAFSFVLRGLDLLPCVLVVMFAFLVILAEAALALFIGALPVTRPFKAVLGLVIVANSLFFSMVGISLIGSMRFGTLAGMAGAPPGFPMALASFAAMIAAAAIVFIVLTTGLLTPPAANRALPVRVMLTILWAVTLWIAFDSGSNFRDRTPLVWWSWTQIALSGLVLLSAVGERERWGVRISRTIPRSPLGRATAFAFYSGGAGGVLWTTLMMTATIVAVDVAGPRIVPIGFVVRESDVTRLLLALATGSFAILAYGLTAVAIHRRFLARRVPQKNTWAVAALLLLVFAVILPLAATLRYMDNPKFQTAFNWAVSADPFMMVESETLSLLRLLGLGLWLIFVAVLNWRWAHEQWAHFRSGNDVTAAVPTVSALEELVSE